MAEIKATTGEIITADSTPNLDDWGWDKFWKANDWLEWHKIMKAKKGKVYADATFISWWGKQTMGANPLDAVAFNPAFRNYLKKENLYDSVTNAVHNIFGAATDVISGSTSAVSSAAKGAENLSKALKFVIPALVIFAGIGISVWAYKKFVK